MSKFQTDASHYACGMMNARTGTGMNKIAHYLNTHMLGEVVTNPAVLAAYSHDGSTLTKTPDLVAFPRATSDLRKITRFSSQLAEKGHILPVIARGAGTDITGASIGKGLITATGAHMNQIFEYDAKQKLVRVQPGVSINTLENALALQGTAIPEFHWEHASATVGGVVASSRSVLECVDQLEVVLANGDVLQTKRLTKREVQKKKGQPGFEGDIYREIDALIDDYKHVVDELGYDDDRLDHEGYASIELVKERDGSIDLAPLFVGSQGTLGIISEMILKSDFENRNPAIFVASFATHAQAHDAVDVIEGVQPSWVEYIDGAFFDAATQAGKNFGFYEEASTDLGSIAASIIVTINDFSERARIKKIKKLRQLLKPFAPHITSTTDLANSDLRSVASITYWVLNPENSDISAPPILDGVYVSLDRFDDFSAGLAELSKKHHVTLALYGRPLDELWYVRPMLRLATVGDKQKLFKLATELLQLVERHGGTPFAAGGEGRFGSSLRPTVENEQTALYQRIKTIFDPNGILNPGAKQAANVRELAKELKSSYSGAAATDHLTKL